MQRIKILLLLSLTLGTGLVTSSNAQAVYGNISGNVTDTSGALVPSATVTITSVDRGTSDTIQTNESGLYVKERLIPGTYEVSVEKQGYKKAVVSKVNVSVDTTTPVDVALDAGQVTETVTVSAAEGQLLKTDRADVATTFESRQIEDLPIIDRNFTKFILLTPGTVQLQWQHAASENPQGSTQTMVNGQNFSGTGYQLDGTDNRDPILGIIVINPNFDAIGETKVTSQNYDAEFGQALAGVVSVQTKSGTNQIHGSLFDFRQDDKLQARNPYSQSQRDAVSGRILPSTLKNQFGGSIGGPIVKDKFFYFGDYQGTRSRVGGTRLLSVPTALARTGNLSQYLPSDQNSLTGVVFDPATTTLNPDGTLQSRQRFAGNIIPTTRLSTQALNILKLIPLPNLPGTDNGTRNNFAASGSEIFNNDTYDVRIDGRPNDKFNIFGRYSYANYRLNGPTAFGQGGGSELVSLGGNSKVRNQSLALGFTYTLSSNSILDVRFGAFKYKVLVNPFDFGKKTASDVGVPNLNNDDFSSGLFGGFVNGDRGFNFGSGLGVNRCNCPLDEDEKQYQVVGNLSKIAGNHTFKFGVDVRRAYNLRVPSDSHRSGELAFDPDRTRGASGGGLGVATFLLGDVTHFGRFVSTSTDARELQWRHFYYAQDTWRATPKLTIAYGLRADVINPQSVNKAGNGGFLDLNTGQILVAGVGGIPLNGGVKNSVNFAPRLGATYQIGQRTVIRAGYGRSYDIGVFGSVFGHSVTQNLPVLSAQDVSVSRNFESVFNLAQGPPAPVFPAVPSNGRITLPNGVFTRSVLFKQRLPSVDAWNVTVQHELSGGFSVEAAYVGNKGTHIFAGDGPTINPNQATLVGFNQGLSLDQRKPFFNKFGWTQGIDYFCNCADNRYNALQTKLTKRFGEGLTLLATYTLQRALNNDGDQFFFNRALNRGRSDTDRTHLFTNAITYELPIGKGRRFLSNAGRGVELALGGWQFNATTFIYSGLPFNVGYDTAGISDTGPNRPDVKGSVKTGGSRDRFFDPTVFAKPQPGTFGNLKRNSLDGPGYWRTDASLFKRFAFTESKQLEFRVESVNFFNHVNLGQPDSFIGDPANPQSNAGRISNTAFFGGDPQRNFQFALKFLF